MTRDHRVVVMLAATDPGARPDGRFGSSSRNCSRGRREDGQRVMREDLIAEGLKVEDREG